MSVYKVSFGSPFPTPFKAFISAIGVIMIVGSANFPPLFILGLLVMIFPWVFSKEQITDLSNWKTRKGWMVFPIRFSRWKPLGRPDTILLSRDDKRDHIAGPISAERISFSSMYYEVDLVEDDFRFDTVLRTSNSEEAELLAEKLSKELGIPVKDIRE